MKTVQEDTVANTDSTNAEGSLARAIWRLELARAKHVMRAYLRTRLLKLEACCAAVLADQSMQTRLSQRELQYAQVSRGPLRDFGACKPAMLYASNVTPEHCSYPCRRHKACRLFCCIQRQQWFLV